MEHKRVQLPDSCKKPLSDCIVFNSFKGNGIMKPNWGVNVEEFKKRFDPEKTNGQGNSIAIISLQSSKSSTHYYLNATFVTLIPGPCWKRRI
jgi:hypothetical protein